MLKVNHFWPGPSGAMFVGRRRRGLSGRWPRLVAGLASVWLGSLKLQACATCFGASNSKMAEGMNMGILFLLGVVAVVVGGITAGFVGLAFRASRLRSRSGGTADGTEVPGVE